MTDQTQEAPAKVAGTGKRRGGRQKGTPNKATTDVRAAMAQIAQKGVGKFWAWLEKIEDPAARCNVYLRLLEFHIPKLNRTIFTGGEADEPVRIEVVGIRAAPRHESAG